MPLSWISGALSDPDVWCGRAPGRPRAPGPSIVPLGPRGSRREPASFLDPRAFSIWSCQTLREFKAALFVVGLRGRTLQIREFYS